MKIIKSKILILVLMLLTVLFFSNDFSLLDIEKTALIVSLGIDYEDEQFEVTAQIAIPQATDFASQNNDAVISAKGDTIADAITEIGIQTGWFPKLSFCNLVLVGRTVAENYVPALIEYTYRSSKLLDSAVIAMCDDTAKEILLATTPLDAISSFALQKILIKSIDKTDAVIANDLRTFSVGYESDSSLGLMPVIKPVKTEDKGKEGDSASVTSAVPTSSGGQESGDKQDQVVFDATSTGVFINGKLVYELTSEDTLTYNILTNTSREAYISVTRTDGNNVLYSMQSDKSKISVEFSDVVPKVTITINIKIKLVDVKKENADSKVLEFDGVSRDLLEVLSDHLTENLNKLVQDSIDNDADVFMLKDNLYRFHHDKFQAYKDVIVKNSYYEICVNVKSYN